MKPNFSPDKEVDRLISLIADVVSRRLKKEGGVVGVSGGVDSATVLALTTRALGENQVLAVAMPDRDSNPISEVLAQELSQRLNVQLVVKNITHALSAMKCYEARDEAVKRIITNFDVEADKFKIILPQDLLGNATLNIFTIVVVKPNGTEIRRRLRPSEFKQIVAASNLKQRTRMATLYFEAECRNYAVVGTANRNEHALGFFVKYGDGGVDLQPIGHLHKTEVFAIAKYLGVPEKIIARQPTTDTYTAETSQEEFFYRIPFDVLDQIWQLDETGLVPTSIAEFLKLTPTQVENVIADIKSKQNTTEYLRLPPCFFERQSELK